MNALPPKPWTAEQLRAFLNAVADDEHAALWRVMATTGLRAAEACALRWRDVDLEHRTITVPPTDRSPGRTVHLDADTTTMLTRMAATAVPGAPPDGSGDASVPEGLSGADSAMQRSSRVFTRRRGRPWGPDSLARSFRHVVAGMGLPEIRLYDLRRLHARALFDSGVDLRAMADRLGVAPTHAVRLANGAIS